MRLIIPSYISCVLSHCPFYLSIPKTTSGGFCAKGDMQADLSTLGSLCLSHFQVKVGDWFSEGRD